MLSFCVSESYYVVCCTMCIAHLLKATAAEYSQLTFPLEVCVLVCVRVREKVMWCVIQNVQINVHKATIITANRPVTCVTSDRENYYCSGRFASVAARLPHYPLYITQRCKILIVAYMFWY